MNFTWRCLFTFLFLGNLVSTRRKFKRSLSVQEDDDSELRRTKRNIYHSLLMKRRKGKRQTLDFNVDKLANPRGAIARPLVKEQVQVVNFEIKVVHEWRDEMKNNTSPAYELLAGNIVDAFGNELVADYHYHSSAVLRLRKADRTHMILADVASRFYKSEGNPLPHIQGIINKGWISGQRVDPNYFVNLGIKNGNLNDIEKLNIPNKLRLRLVPPPMAITTPTPPQQNRTETLLLATAKYKEIKISIKLKQLYGMFLSDRKSPEYKELSGNVEQAIYKIFARDLYFLGTRCLGFRESPEGRCIVVVAMDFKFEEKYAIEKSQAMISSGDLAGMPVDDTYLIVNSLSEIHNGGENKPSNPLVQHPNASIIEAVKNLSVSTVAPFTPEEFAKAMNVNNTPLTPSPPESRSNVTTSTNASVVPSLNEIIKPIVPLTPLPEAVTPEATAPEISQSTVNETSLPLLLASQEQNAANANVTTPPESEATTALQPDAEGAPAAPQANVTVTEEPISDEQAASVEVPSNATAVITESELNMIDQQPTLPDIVAEAQDAPVEDLSAATSAKSAPVTNETVPVVPQAPFLTNASLVPSPDILSAIHLLSNYQNTTTKYINNQSALYDQGNNLEGGSSTNITMAQLIPSAAVDMSSKLLPPPNVQILTNASAPVTNVTDLSNTAAAANVTPSETVVPPAQTPAPLSPPIPAAPILPSSNVAPVNATEASEPAQGGSLLNLTASREDSSTPKLFPQSMSKLTEATAQNATAVLEDSPALLMPQAGSAVAPPNTAAVSSSTPNRVPTVANIISSLVNASSSIPVITEAPAVSDESSVPVNVPASVGLGVVPVPATSANQTAAAESTTDARTNVGSNEEAAQALVTPATASAAKNDSSQPPESPVVPAVYPQALSNGTQLPSTAAAAVSPPATSEIQPEAISPAPVNLTTAPEEVAEPSEEEKPQPILINQMSAPLQYEEVTVALRLLRPWDEPLSKNNSVPFVELSGEVIKAIDDELTKDPFYVDAAIQEFLKDPNSTTIAHASVRFLPEEVDPVDTLKKLVTNGGLGVLTLDQNFFFVLSIAKSTASDLPEPEKTTQPITTVTQEIIEPIEESSQNATEVVEEAVAEPQNVTINVTTEEVAPPKPQKPKPLMFKEIRVSLRMKQQWNSSFSNNNSLPYSIFSGVVEQAVDRGLMSNPNYIDSTVLELDEDDSPQNTLVFIGIRFRVQEIDPETKVRALIKTGSLSGKPVDENFFEVFSISETDHPKPPDQQLQNGTIVAVSTLGQKQPATTLETNATVSQDTSSSSAIKTPIPPVNASDVKTEIPITIAPLNSPTNSQDKTFPSVYPTEIPPSTFSLDNGPTVAATAPPNSLPPLASDRVVTLPPSAQTQQPVSQIIYPPEAASKPAVIAVIVKPAPAPAPSPPASPAPAPSASPAPAPPAPPAPAPPVPPPVEPAAPVSSAPVPAVSSAEPIPTFATTASTLTAVAPDADKPGSSALNEVEGTMILEQDWHPYLADKTSSVYHAMEQTVISGIKNVYAQSNEEVIPQVLAFTEVESPDDSAKNASDTRVEVHFKIMFLPGHKSDTSPLQSAIQANTISGMLVYPTSFALKASGTVTHTVDYTSCQQLHNIAMSAADGQIGGFIPECTPDGNFKSAQCHALTGFCWCVNHVGVRIIGTEERYKEPRCDGMILTGQAILPEEAPSTLLPGSCLTVSIQESILCGGNVNCHLPLLGNKTFKNVVMKDKAVEYSLPLMQLKPGSYVVTAVLNVGWCRISSVLSKDLIHEGDYHSTTLHDVVVGSNTKIMHKDIELELVLPEETGITLSGDILLPSDAPEVLPPGSCLIIQTRSWNPSTPVIGNMTVIEPDILNNTIAYSMHLPDIDPGSYIVRCVLHLNTCDMMDNVAKPGEYFTEKKYQVSPDTTEVDEDLELVKQSPFNQGVTVKGKVILPTGYTSFSRPSCLTIKTQRSSKECPETSCLPQLVKKETFDVLPEEEYNRYSILLPNALPGKYFISAVLNDGWCAEENIPLAEGDKFNDLYSIIIYEFMVKEQGNSVIEKDIELAPFSDYSIGVTLHGRIKLPETFNRYASSKSCLILQVREFNPSFGGNTGIDRFIAEHVSHKLQYEGEFIHYAMQLPKVRDGRYQIDAIMNVGWCSGEEINGARVMLRSGDYHNSAVEDFMLYEGEGHVGYDFEMSEYNPKPEPVPAGITVYGKIILPSTAQELNTNSCLTIQIKEYKECTGVGCSSPTIARSTYENVQLMNRIIQYDIYLPNTSYGHFIITAVINNGWCFDGKADEWIKVGDFINDELRHFIVLPHQIDVEVDIQLNHFVALTTTTTPAAPATSVPSKVTQAAAPPATGVASPSAAESTAAPAIPVASSLNPASPPAPVVVASAAAPSVPQPALAPAPAAPVSLPGDALTSVSALASPAPVEPAPVSAAPEPASPVVSLAPSVPVSKPADAFPSVVPPNVTAAAETVISSSDAAPAVPVAPPTSPPATPPPVESNGTVPASLTATSSDGNYDYQFTLLTNPNYVEKNDSDEYVYRTGLLSVNNSDSITNASTPHLIALPNGLPKSCQGIRDAGIGNIDGQYIIEARENCHISVICVNMDDEDTKEFLGGPSEEEWRYWHYAVLIKISDADKKNLPTGACLESSGQGKELLRRILVAGNKEGNPISQWKTKISEFIRRKKRHLPDNVSFITKPRLIRKEARHRLWTSRKKRSE